MNMLKMCLNWKVITAVALVGVGLFVYAPGLALSALPFLVIAICPLSMLLMMGAMNGMGGDSKSGEGCAMSGQKQPEGREGELAQLKAQQVELASKIDSLEAEELDSRQESQPRVGAAVRTS